MTDDKPLTDAELEAIGAEHYDGDDHYAGSPCRVCRLLSEVKRLRGGGLAECKHDDPPHKWEECPVREVLFPVATADYWKREAARQKDKRIEERAQAEAWRDFHGLNYPSSEPDFPRSLPNWSDRLERARAKVEAEDAKEVQS